MDTTETQNRQGSRDKAPDDNVVRLPRDWLGPREDLVPFGPSAHRDPPAPVTELPRSADDFWGGGADLQDLAAATEEVSEAPARRWSLPSLSRPHVSFPRVRLGARTALLIGLGVLGLLAAVGFVLGSVARRPSAPTRTAASSAQSPASAPSIDARATELRDTAAQRASRARARARGEARARHLAEVRVRRARESARRHRQHSRVSTVKTVHHTTPSPVATSDTAGSSSVSHVSESAPTSGTDTAAASPSPAAGSSQPTTTSGASTGGGSSSSNQPALGANGSLGPGSSPDG